MRNTTTTHAAANCQSTRLGYRLSSVGESQQPENLWVCVRDGGRRAVSDDECAHCARWEASDDTKGMPLALPVFLSPIWRE